MLLGFFQGAHVGLKGTAPGPFKHSAGFSRRLGASRLKLCRSFQRLLGASEGLEGLERPHRELQGSLGAFAPRGL